jgi:hypothetical protein
LCASQRFSDLTNPHGTELRERLTVKIEVGKALLTGNQGRVSNGVCRPAKKVSQTDRSAQAARQDLQA